MQWLLIPFVVIAGALNAVQSGSNQTLNKRLDHPFVSAMCVYAGGILATSVAWLVTRLATGKGLRSASAFAEVPWYAEEWKVYGRAPLRITTLGWLPSVGLDWMFQPNGATGRPGTYETARR